MSIKTFFTQFFTWWNGETLGTRLFTWRKGERVGEDEQGNVYYRGPLNSDGKERRWVIFNGTSEASRVPPGWEGWMRYRYDTPPVDETYKPHEWEKPHEPNLTGTPLAYRPPGAMVGQAHRPQVTGDYDAWTPGN